MHCNKINVLQCQYNRGPARVSSIYFPLYNVGEHFFVLWCRPHTNASGVIATSHIVASHITQLLLSFRQMLQFHFRENPQGRFPWSKQSHFCQRPMEILPPPLWSSIQKSLTFSTTPVLLRVNVPLSLSRETFLRRQKHPRRGYRPKTTGILFVRTRSDGQGQC